jgi:dTDP-4-dehydrorhamnose 3,5-epimerase
LTTAGRVKLLPTPLEGVLIVDTMPHEDHRGTFRRLWCQREIGAATGNVVQSSLSETRKRGTLRGMHFQSAPSREGKLISCVRGRIYDVALDLRPKSPSYLRHFGIDLQASDRRSLYIPPGCAHGFLTLADDSAVLYMMSDFYEPALTRGVRWNDPAFGIVWPERPQEMMERDAAYPDFDPRTVDGFVDY